MPSWRFTFRASTRKGGGAGRLYLRVVHRCESRSVTTPYKIFPGEWDADGRHLIVPFDHGERARQLREYEDAMSNDLRRMEGLVKRLDKEGDYDIDELMERYRAVTTGNSLRAYAEKLASEMNQAGNHRTARAYLSAATRLRLFNGGKDIKAEHFTAGLLTDFQAALKAEGRSPNTISFYMRNLRAIYNKAISEGRLFRRAENPFAGVYTGVSPTRKLALTPDELARLSEFNPAEKQVRGNRQSEVKLTLPLQQALAMFLFCYHARGMCFVDLAHLRKSDLLGDILRYGRQKTGQEIEISVHPAMRRIIEWFSQYTAGSPYLFPIISDPNKDHRLQYESGLRRQNNRLKRIAELTGIKKRFSTHCARHSWATVARNEGLPLAVISEGLGHTNQKTTEIYLASLERSILDQATMVVSNVINPQYRAKKNRRQRGGESSSGGLPGYINHGFRFGSYR